MLLPRLLELLGSVRMKRQERLGKGDTNPTPVTDPHSGWPCSRGALPQGVSGIVGCPR